jgi:acetolactate synthase-1/2/3 large subunit
MAVPIRVADYVMQAIARAGVGHVFMLPGGGAMHLNDALARSGLGWVPCHHEQACGIAAEAYGRISENLGVALVTTGPGATNVVTPVAGAWIESSPMLVVSGQVKRADRLRGAPVRQRGVQEVDIVPMVSHVTKYAVTVEDPSRIRWHLEKALLLARSGRRGPVWIDLPLDVQAAPIEPDTLEPYDPARDPSAVPDAAMATPDPAALATEAREVLRLLESAKRPLVLAGHGVRLSGAARAFRELAERLGLPVATTWNALDLLPADHPLAVGRPGVVALRTPNFAVQSCDLLVAIGCRLDNVVTAYNPRNFAPGARKVIVDVDPHELARHDLPDARTIAADASDFVAALAAASADRPALGLAPWLERIAAWKARYPVTLDGLPEEGGRMSHYRFVEQLSDALPAGTLIATGSSGLAVEVFYTNFRNREGQRVFLTSGLGSMGYGLAAGIGACIASGGPPMVVVESDGSLMLNIQELATLKALALPIVVVVMNNDGYASIRNTQRNYFEGRYIGTGPGSGLVIPDLAEVARAFGLPARRIGLGDDLQGAIAEALARGGPALIDVQLVPNESLAPKVSAIPRADGSIISMPLEDMTPLLPLEVLEREIGRVDPASVAARAAV